MFCCRRKKKPDEIIIDWSQSLSQCGGDEDFLHELLRETHKEIKNPISEIDNFSDNSIREYSHMVKGVSQNMFCEQLGDCLLYTSPSPRDQRGSRMPSSA